MNHQFAVNLSTIFTEVPFIERFVKARDAGFTTVECQFPYEHSVEEIQRELELNSLKLALINLPPGDWQNGDRGITVEPNRMEEFKKSVKVGIQYAVALNVKNIHCMAGIGTKLDSKLAKDTFLKNLHYAATEMEKHGITLLIEPINLYDIPGYYLNNLQQAEEIITLLDRPNLKMQFDFYHIQRIHGNPLPYFIENRDLIGHVQIADNPGRHEPGTGKMDYASIFSFLEERYSGYIGLEYLPLKGSEASFEWLNKIAIGGK
ncbi:TIM barrel protein [Mesobacillus maritimus]|uniref:hydroxypyruvate isomerase family protein n=1 Tax=Mesobacillus maritimus TaxID=1643336 RepID=UPI002040FA6E|nr:TIM barrel protein [Mesobacillus maritimus]MCM3671618.1 TIM barrel protein [Mesobacillus maritimus]